MIEARGLTKRFGSNLAVDDLSFEVLPGKVTGFLGPNGSGKSTTMRLVLGLDAPTAGDVTVNGRSYRSLTRPLFEVGALLDASAIHPGRSARDHLRCIAASNGIGDSRVAAVLELVGLETVARRRAGVLSLGMRQRLGIAAALLGDPGTLLFDEPVNGLDPEGILWVRTLLRALAAEGRTVFVSSHLMSEMALTADHLIVVGRGRLIADSGIREFLEHATTASVRVVTPAPTRLVAALERDGAAVRVVSAGAGRAEGTVELEITGPGAARVGELALAEGVVLHELVTTRASLEDAYMELTADSVEFKGTTMGSRP